jgi:RNA polymerase sigma-70 factor (ECF subfamily)
VRELPSFTYDPGRSFRAWLRSILLNRWRALARRPAMAPLVAEPAADDPEAGRLADLEEAEYRRYLVGRGLRLLQPEFSPTLWRAFEQHVLAGRPAAEVAAELSVAPGTVYVAKSRVLRRLREELAGLLD